ncbi:MAG: FAD-binding protein [Acidobacteriota bacterium]
MSSAQETELLAPAEPREVPDIVRAAPRLYVRGGGTKPWYAASEESGVATLSTRGLSAIVEYEPAEYTITALAGTPLAELQSELAKHGQSLPFDPPFVEAGSTVGGCVATGVNGPGRVRYGGLRDFVLGVRFVDGRGREVRGGGKVVKNAAGFDLAKLMVGSCGSLGVLTEVTFKVFPAAAASLSIALQVSDLDGGLRALERAATCGTELASLQLEPDRLLARLGGRAESLERRGERFLEAVGGGKLLAAAEDRLWRWESFAQDRVTVRVPVDRRSARGLLEGLPGEVGWRVLGAAHSVLLELPEQLLEDVAKQLRRHDLVAQILHGAPAGRLGGGAVSELEARVTGVLDPDARFAAPALRLLR